MELKALAKQPQLIQITLDDEDIVKEYGEALTFWAMDRQPMDTFLKVAGNTKDDFATMAQVLKDLILDAEGNPVIKDGFVLPGKVLVSAFAKLVEILGK